MEYTTAFIYRAERTPAAKYLAQTNKLMGILSYKVIILTFIIMISYHILYFPVETNINVNYALKESQVIPDLVQTHILNPVKIHSHLVLRYGITTINCQSFSQELRCVVNKFTD